MIGGAKDGLLAGIERAVDATLLALAKGHLQRRPPSLDDIEKSVIGTYTEWASSHVAAQLGHGPCGDTCLLMPGIEAAIATLGRVIVEHVALEIDLLIQIQAATGKSPDVALREVYGRCRQGEVDGG